MERRLNILFCTAVIALMSLMPLGLLEYRLSSLTIGGVYVRYDRPVFSWKAVFAKKYQPMAEGYYQQNFFGQVEAVYLRNQLYDWANFNTVHKGGSAIEGSDNVLLMPRDLTRLYQDLPVSDAGCEYYFQKIKQLFDLLEAQGIDCIFLLAPDKIVMNPEFIPKWHGLFWRQHWPAPQPEYSRILDKYGIRNFDAFTYLMNTDLGRETGRLKYFSKASIHWDAESMGQVMPVLFQQINADKPEGEKYRLRVPTKVVPSDKAYYNEDDLGVTINSYVNRPLQRNEFRKLEFLMPYFEPNAGSVLLFGDSYLEQPLSYFFMSNMFRVRDAHHIKNSPPDAEILDKWLKNARVFILVYTSTKMHGVPEDRHQWHCQLYDMILERLGSP